MKLCPRCEVSYPASTQYFHRNNQAVGGLHCYCKKCKGEMHQKYYENEAVQSKMNQTAKLWRENNPERARANGAKYAKSKNATIARRKKHGATARVFKSKENRFPEGEGE